MSGGIGAPMATNTTADNTASKTRKAKPKGALTDKAVSLAKPRETARKLADGNGLYLLINPNGSKLWRWKYRAGGKEKLMALGAYSDVSLTSARDARDQARKTLAQDVDPMAERKAAKQARQLSEGNSFAVVARLWWNDWKAARSPSHVDYVLRRLEADVFPAIGARPIDPRRQGRRASGVAGYFRVWDS